MRSQYHIIINIFITVHATEVYRQLLPGLWNLAFGKKLIYKHTTLTVSITMAGNNNVARVL